VAPSDPPHEPSDRPSEGGPFDALRRLEHRLDRASEAAERLIAEAAAHATGRAADPSAQAAGRAADPPKPPPAGWQFSEPNGELGAGRGGDLGLLMAALQSLRDLIPPELQRRLAEALRELLLAVRALLDWYLERLERVRAEPVEVQDIPIL